ncbi:hypothetical protein B0T22DRAFT_483333 [Podospora appendiculata]|uniref:Uncharacterized protein n=1 Tax=Podospora appendiculata TaxID=314037 RepID=A0AAE0X2B0_9PEZI|nr:hypothetical protein B0T22DRAFT_483333 [Podospora appendiculata]
MAYISLSKRDINVLEKIRDPDSDPSSAVQIDPSLPKDPNILNQHVFETVSREERSIILSIQEIEVRSCGPGSRETAGVDMVAEYRKCVSQLGHLIQEHPKYASARNNRAQAIRRLCGDSMLVAGAQQPPQALLQDITDGERQEMASTALSDLDTAISLLTPTKLNTRLSPQTAKTLSMAHTQRAAIYHMTSKLIGSSPLSVGAGRREASWTKLEFEENASRDFAMGGRYGNEIAKALAVSTNPTAKLCGQMVREAMKKEYGPDYAV